MKITFALVWVVSALTMFALHQVNTSLLLAVIGGALAAVGLLTVWCGIWLGRLISKNKTADEDCRNVFGKLIRRRQQEP
ncbi:MAG TPA: hypothetical protein VFV57_10620 [Limnobacter sp.]|nr:hypothetical protein [Limnobacter sp.]